MQGTLFRGAACLSELTLSLLSLVRPAEERTTPVVAAQRSSSTPNVSFHCFALIKLVLARCGHDGLNSRRSLEQARASHHSPKSPHCEWNHRKATSPMKISTVLSLRSLTSKIHQPLPLNPRESQKLLSLLKASFRQQLDREHPVTSSGQAHDAHHHLHSILTNPLFNMHSRKRRSSLRGRGDGHLFVRRPMEYFKEQVAAGTATLDIAKQYLQVQYKSAVASSDLEVTNSLRCSAAGSTVLSWLWSSGLEGSNAFLLDSTFVAAIMPFLVAEGHQTIAWRWLRRLQTNFESKQAEAASDVADSRRSTANVLLQLVKSELKYGAGLNAAMKCFLCLTGDEAFAGPLRTDSWAQSKVTYGPAGKYLIHVLVHRSADTVPDVGLYDDFVQRVGAWTPPTANYIPLLLVHHPIRPDWAPALHRLRSLSPEMLLAATLKKRRRTVQLCLDTAGLLLSQGRQVDAIWVMELAQKIFPEKFDVEQSAESTSLTVSTEETSQHSDEASNLQLLEALAAH